MTQVVISSDEPRSIKAISLAAEAGQWLKCKTSSGQKAYGVPSSCKPGEYYLTTCQTCTCPDFKYHAVMACKHILAVRLHCELVKATHPRPRLTVVPTAAQKYEDIFRRFED